ncbi:MAG: hypothetical protein ACTSXS_09305, partial [Candidatus Thorarchaeota archaeon]
EIIGNGVGNREQALLLSVIITILGYFAGGGLAPVSLLPQPYRSITLLSPMTYALDFWIRSFFIGSQGILLFPIFMLFFWWILLTALGAVLLSRRSIK